MSMAAKHAEVHALFWRIQHEQAVRDGSTPADSVEAGMIDGLAARIPAEVNGRPVSEASPEELLIGACEHAGMLAVIRWAEDARRDWADAALMTTSELPF